MDLRFVIDASVGVKWVVPEPEAQESRRLRDAYASGELRLIAPDLYATEVANILWKKHRLRGEMSTAQAEEALHLLLAALPEVEPTAPLMSQALQLALLHGCTVYDCTYVALALREGCPLVTADAALARRLAPSLGTVATLSQAAELLATARSEHDAERWS